MTWKSNSPPNTDVCYFCTEQQLHSQTTDMDHSLFLPPHLEPSPGSWGWGLGSVPLMTDRRRYQGCKSNSLSGESEKNSKKTVAKMVQSHMNPNGSTFQSFFYSLCYSSDMVLFFTE